jgi:hypothetical protein
MPPARVLTKTCIYDKHVASRYKTASKSLDSELLPVKNGDFETPGFFTAPKVGQRRNFPKGT